MAKSIRVTISATCRLQIPGEPNWQEATLFERSVEIAGNNPDGTPGIKLEKGSQRFEFHLILPATLATYDRHPLARLTHNIKAVVEGVHEKPVHSPFALFGGIGKGKQKEKARGRSRPGSRASSPTGGQRTPSTSRNGLGARSHTASFDRHLNTAGHPSPGHVPGRDTPPPTPFGYSHDNSGSYSTLSSLNPSYTPSYSIPEHADYVSVPMSRDNSVVAFDDEPEIKPLRGHLSTERHLIIAANPFEANTPNNLSIIKTGNLAGVGDWKLSLQSDEVSPLIRCNIGGGSDLLLTVLRWQLGCSQAAIHIAITKSDHFRRSSALVAIVRCSIPRGSRFGASSLSETQFLDLHRGQHPAREATNKGRACDMEGKRGGQAGRAFAGASREGGGGRL